MKNKLYLLTGKDIDVPTKTPDWEKEFDKEFSTVWTSSRGNKTIRIRNVKIEKVKQFISDLLLSQKQKYRQMGEE